MHKRCEAREHHVFSTQRRGTEEAERQPCHDRVRRNQEAQRGSSGEKACVEILVTGSLYLVGSALEAVGWDEGESQGRLD